MVGDPDGGDGLAFGLVFKFGLRGRLHVASLRSLAGDREAQVDLRLVPFRDLGGSSLMTGTDFQ
jgi:hypothetical protein